MRYCPTHAARNVRTFGANDSRLRTSHRGAFRPPREPLPGMHQRKGLKAPKVAAPTAVPQAAPSPGAFPHISEADLVAPGWAQLVEGLEEPYYKIDITQWRLVRRKGKKAKLNRRLELVDLDAIMDNKVRACLSRPDGMGNSRERAPEIGEGVWRRAQQPVGRAA